MLPPLPSRRRLGCQSASSVAEAEEEEGERGGGLTELMNALFWGGGGEGRKVIIGRTTIQVVQ